MSEVPGRLGWLKAAASGSNGCVEIAALPDGGVAVRDSKNATSPILTYTAHEWRCFLDGAKKGEFDHLV